LIGSRSRHSSGSDQDGPVAGEPGGPPPFSQARTIGGLALLFLAGAEVLIDAFSGEFQVDSVQLGLVLGTALLLLGVEAGRRLLG
jgi:hypothetical protein